ncbi:MAG: 16S rRNA (cytosine(1402)-N(4))-methyltransferase RsmH [Planctomycetota bacterium]|nr:MAG: 16S rRNA (cytosine(1402)-N(4))-methyltransferase RsmH [Planctomycetota bacterium]
MVHTPVMVSEVREGLALKPGAVVVDATVGAGGHALALIGDIGPEGVYLGIDRDPDILEIAKKNLAEFDNFRVRHGNFEDLPGIMAAEALDKADAVLFDLGVSSYQLSEARRGFSFSADGPLDMRFDPAEGVPSAAEILNRIPGPELADVLQRYGDERRAKRIARAICARRGAGPIRTTTELAELIVRTVGRRGRIHPATRTFQALRVLVNGELRALEKALSEVPGLLAPGGRVAVISFHSGEDRIVKNAFREAAKEGLLEIITRKPLVPERIEVVSNPRARSAKLRIAQRKEMQVSDMNAREENR